jgi:signal transduction histidine kinase
VLLLAAGVGINVYLITGAVKQRDDASLLSRGYSMAVPFMPAMSEERRASIAVAANPSPQNKQALDQARQGFTQLMMQFGSISTEVANTMPPGAKAAIGKFVGLMQQIPALRQQIDSGQANRVGVYQSFNQIADAMIVAADAIGRDSNEKNVALQRSVASDLMRLSDWVDRSNALAAAAYSNGGLSTGELDEYDTLTRAYRADVDAIEPRLPEQDQRQLRDMKASGDWSALQIVGNTLIQQGFDTRPRKAGEPQPLPIGFAQWQDAVRHTGSTLSSMGLGDIGTSAAASEKQAADDAVTRSLVIAAGSLLVSILALLLSVRMGNDLVRRLRRLRADTLAADERLPQVVNRIRRGERVDVAAEVPELDYGTDEIGEVAAAFTKAQQTAVAATVQEAQLREGTNAVFLNIARRSQAVVHRQLRVLDKAERTADDPDQVDLLFQLDHLSTRERRNAENLIILGGGSLTRQWRTAVNLVDVARSAVAETEQYNRVSFGKLPDLPVAGRVVADLVHLLAELVDNAIEFSPPQSRIEVRGNPVGKGAVLEIDDQGLGMTADEVERVNAMFREPPDFGVMALTDDSRIGFFVVATLARQHDIRVSLMESSYGGIRAVVLIPNTLITVNDIPPDADDGGPRTDWFGTPVPGAEHTSPGNGKPILTIPAMAGGPREELPAAEPDPPRHSRHRAEPGAPQPETPWWPTSQPTEGRPTLPKRDRQSSLAPQLLDTPEPEAEDPMAESVAEVSAAEAKDMMAAFQRGTQRGRADDQLWAGWPLEGPENED